MRTRSFTLYLIFQTLIFPKEISQSLKDNLKKKPFYLFTADYSTGVCEGYRLDREISVDSDQSALICSSEKVWKFVLPVDKGGKIVDIVVKRQHGIEKIIRINC